MKSLFVPKSKPKITEISALEVYYFKVSTKESLSSCKTYRAEIFVIFGWDFGKNDDFINSF